MGELEYIDNIDYGQGEEAEPSLDAMLEELAERCGLDADASTLYEAIHQKILREIRVDELAITRIMPDIISTIVNVSERKGMLLMHLLADPYLSYSELGEKMGYSKQRVAIVLHELASKYEWLQRLLELHNE